MSIELACCLLVTVAALYYIFYPATFFVGPDNAKTPFTKISAT